MIGRSRISRRRLLAGMLGATGAAVLAAACGGSPAPAAPTAAPKAADKPADKPASKPADAAKPAAGAPAAKTAVNLRVAINATEQRTQELSKIANGVAQKNPGITVEFTPIQAPDHDQFFVKLLTEMAGGKPTDLVSVATEGTQLFAGKDLSLKLDDFVKADQSAMKEYFSDTSPALVEAMMYEGSLYELPTSFNAANMYLNLDALAKAGIAPPSDNWTHEEFREIARKLAAKKDATGQPEVFGYAWTNRHWGGYVPWVFVNGSNLLTEERAPGGEWMWSTFYADDPAAKGRGGGWRWNASSANDPKNVEALQFLVDLTKEKGALDPASGGGAAQQANFVSGKVGMTPAGAFWAAGLVNAGMKEGTFDARLFPKWKTQRHQFGAGGLLGLKASPARDQMWEFMKYWVSKEAISAFMGTPTSTTSGRRSLMTEDRMGGIKNWKVFYDTLDKHPDTAPIPAPPESNQFATLMIKYVDLAITGEQTAQAALDGLHTEVTKLLQARAKS
ncbi:MAG: extracellular solute-binding protein [Chloroflexi bacterium]|nr:extracellular solute-binding protein [Chloroflexota bacterium]